MINQNNILHLEIPKVYGLSRAQSYQEKYSPPLLEPVI